MTPETVSDELQDMSDMVVRDRNHPSVILWSFCNEVGCNNESAVCTALHCTACLPACLSGLAPLF